MKNRKKRYFGLHFDFHAAPDAHVGKRVTNELFERYLTEVKPDFVQVDSKGHPGNASFKSSTDNSTSIDRDLLMDYREITNKHNIPLYVHYSGCWDSRYVKDHPEYALTDKDGNKNENLPSQFSPYIDEVMIPNLKELNDKYHVDGVWVDGDCWAVYNDFSDVAKPYLKPDCTITENNYIVMEKFRQNLKKYVSAMHEHNPEFRVCSNWAYTSYMPEQIDTGVDFISGDFPANNAIRTARYEGRCMANRDIQWDLMAWGFDILENSHYYKCGEQLKQEAASIITLGGGYQIYNMQRADGTFNEHPIKAAKEVGEFMRKREELCYGKKPTAQVGIYYSKEARYTFSKRFNAAGTTNSLIGITGCVLDAQHTAEIFYEYQLENINKYDVVIFPEWSLITEEEKKVFTEYAANGGKLVVIGAKASKLFEDCYDCKWIEYHESKPYFIHQSGLLSGFETNFYEVECDGPSAYTACDIDTTFSATKIKSNYGKGSITAVFFDLGTSYFKMRSTTLRDFMNDVLCDLYNPMVNVNQRYVDITLQPDGDDMIVNFININGEHADRTISTFDYIPKVYHLKVDIDLQGKYKNIYLPLEDNKRVDFELKNGHALFEIDIEDLHQAVVLTEQE
ncbi:MAG: alpha-L-fucosidase [Clostridia bacterium]|nr:alpha-L-fucosidase [Clostridia bacterium]